MLHKWNLTYIASAFPSPQRGQWNCKRPLQGRVGWRWPQTRRIRRICFLALTMEVLRYDQSNQPSLPPKDLQSYNYGICNSWLRQYYSGDFHIPRDWRICVTWRERPTWAALIQQLFDWDDQHLYRHPFPRDRWKNLQYRLVTQHAFDEIS